MTVASLRSGLPTAPKPTLLFVDDEERILRSLRLLFAPHYRVLTTTNGHEALAILKREKVHALISDQRMPVMAGVDLLRQARAIAPNTMRLLLTGYSDLDAILGSINEGEVFRYISKPWNAEDIRRIVAEAADIAQQLDRPATPEAGDGTEDAVSVLLIDDSPETAAALGALIRESLPAHIGLEQAATVGDALTLLERANVAVVVSEVCVGGEDITPFLKTLKRFRPHIVTVVLTAFHDAGQLVGLINQAQVYRVLPKPLRRNLTLRSIQSGLDRSREIRCRPEAALRHKVDAPAQDTDSGLVARILNLFQRTHRPAPDPRAN